MTAAASPAQCSVSPVGERPLTPDISAMLDDMFARYTVQRVREHCAANRAVREALASGTARLGAQHDAQMLAHTGRCALCDGRGSYLDADRGEVSPCDADGCRNGRVTLAHRSPRRERLAHALVHQLPLFSRQPAGPCAPAANLTYPPLTDAELPF